MLRPGAISVAMIEECIGLKTMQSNSEIRVSGALENHYSPVAKVLLCEVPIAGQGFIALASNETPVGVVRLASPENDEEFARILYSALRAADTRGLAEVVVLEPTGRGIAVAIRDRLARAKSKSDLENEVQSIGSISE